MLECLNIAENPFTYQFEYRGFIASNVKSLVKLDGRDTSRMQNDKASDY